MVDSVGFVDVRPGVLVSYQGQTFVITHVLDFRSVLLRNLSNQAVVRARIRELRPNTSELPDETSKTISLASIPDEDWAIAQNRLSAIRPLLGQGRMRSHEDVEARAAEYGVARSTIYAWLQAYEKTGQLSALLPKERSDKGVTRLPEAVEAIIQTAIEEIYLTAQRKPIVKVCEAVRQRCLASGLTPPHPNTVRNRIASLSRSYLVKRRFGQKVAQQHFAPIEGEFPGADFPLAVVQIDHTKVDLILVDDLHRSPIGRPWITLAVDVFSRMVVGFYVSFDPPGALSVGLCLAQAILPKDQWLAKHDLAVEWPVWGLPRMLHMDNAREFRGRMLQRACAQYGINISWRPVARPHFGGHIERLLGTIAREIHSLPGTTFSNTHEKGQYYKSEDKAALTLSEFERWLTTWITCVYHQRPHGALGVSPMEKYREGVFGTDERPGAGTGLMPSFLDETKFRLDFMPFVERTVQPYGVVIDDVHYYHDVLRMWINAVDATTGRKRKFEFRRDPRDISRIWFFDPQLHQYFEIPYRDTSRPAISIWELREAERAVREAGKNVDEQAIFAAYEHMREIEAKALAKTKAARRAQQRRRSGIGAVQAHDLQSSVPIQSEEIGDIEPFDDLDDLSHERQY